MCVRMSWLSKQRVGGISAVRHVPDSSDVDKRNGRATEGGVAQHSRTGHCRRVPSGAAPSLSLSGLITPTTKSHLSPQLSELLFAHVHIEFRGNRISNEELESTITTETSGAQTQTETVSGRHYRLCSQSHDW